MGPCVSKSAIKVEESLDLSAITKKVPKLSKPYRNRLYRRRRNQINNSTGLCEDKQEIEGYLLNDLHKSL